MLVPSLARHEDDVYPFLCGYEILTCMRQVREAHKAGVEVILDVVFNHTAEGNEQGPSISFRCAVYL